MPDIIATIIAKYNYWIYITLMMIGLYAIIAKNNLVKKIIGMNIFRRPSSCFMYLSAPKEAPRFLSSNMPMAPIPRRAPTQSMPPSILIRCPMF